MTPQLKYMRECRADPLFRRYELDRQKIRRSTPEYRAKAAAYFRRRYAARKRSERAE